jgi:hypothetical protein
MRYRKTALLEVIAREENGDYKVQNAGDPSDQWVIPQATFEATYEEIKEDRAAKDLGITEVRGAKANISDLVVYGDGDTFKLLCKASSKAQGWMKSTKVCNVSGGCLVQVTTQQQNPDGSYAVAEALTYVPGMNIDTGADPRRLVSIGGVVE